jgi:antitoxin YefM
MLKATAIDFSQNINLYLDKVENDNETIVIERNNGTNSILLSASEYNSILETIYLLSSNKNAEHLYASIKEYEEGKYTVKELIEV